VGTPVDRAAESELARDSFPGRTRDFEAVLHSLADGVVAVDLEGRILFANKVAVDMVGIDTLESPIGKWRESFACYLPDGISPYPADELPLPRAIGGEEVRDAEVFVRNSQNSEGVLLSINASPLKDAAGVISGGVMVFRDITERKKSSELLQQLSNAVQQTADSVIIARSDGTIEYVNPAFEQTTGYRSEEVIGKTPRVLKSGIHDESLYENLWSTVLAGETYRGTLVNRKKSGELYHAENTITPVKDANGTTTHLVAVVKDITERKKSEKQDFELRLAREVQQRLFPTASPHLPGYDIAGASLPAGEMGGDYFDYIPMPQGCVGIVIGDVSGHGLGPSLLMAQTRAYLRSLARTTSDVGEIARLLNESLVDDTADGSYVTLLITCLDPDSGSLTYTNAGHVSGLILDGSGSVRMELKSTSVPVGLFPGRTFKSGPAVDLRPGDLIALFTDGITESEAPDGTSFRSDGVREVVREHRHLPAGQIVDKLCDAARGFAQGSPQLDDVTAVIVKVDPAT
jgi:PAS domain S-box-containing protein